MLCVAHANVNEYINWIYSLQPWYIILHTFPCTLYLLVFLSLSLAFFPSPSLSSCPILPLLLALSLNIICALRTPMFYSPVIVIREYRCMEYPTVIIQIHGWGSIGEQRNCFLYIISRKFCFYLFLLIKSLLASQSVIHLLENKRGTFPSRQRSFCE